MKGRTVYRGAGYAAVVLAASGVAWVGTRQGDRAAAPASHAHGTVAGGDSARPVMLSPAGVQRIGITYAVATLGSIDREVRAAGQVVLDERRVQSVAPRVDGFVEQLHVSATGQPVSRGQALLGVYSPMLVQAQDELLLAKRLLSDMSTGSAEAQRGAAELVASARRRLEYWDIAPGEIEAIERAGVARKTITLRSPATGFVLQKAVVQGQRVMAGEALFRIADLRTVWVEGELFEQDLADVRAGVVAHADFPALPDEHRMGRVDYVYPTLDAGSRTARVRVVLPNADLRLKPGMYATLRFDTRRRTSGVSVPRDAVLSTGQRHLVYVLAADGRLLPREVALGARAGERVEVLRGLAAGETVVASATFLVDAEASLVKSLGGMGDMPGMDVTSAPAVLPMRGGATPRAPPVSAPTHTGHAGGRVP